jgi:hypothetical protein
MSHVRDHVTTGTRRPTTQAPPSIHYPPPLRSHDHRAAFIDDVRRHSVELARLVNTTLRRSPRREQLLAELARVPMLAASLYDHHDTTKENV